MVLKNTLKNEIFIRFKNTLKNEISIGFKNTIKNGIAKIQLFYKP